MFVSASSSRLDPHSTCSRRFLAGCNARSSLGLRAHRQPDKPVQRLGTLSCLRAFVPVLLDQRFAIDPCRPSLVSFESSVILLEPRTPHQSAKLKNVPKNEYLFTLFSFSVNQNVTFLSPAKSIECSWFTETCEIAAVFALFRTFVKAKIDILPPRTRFPPCGNLVTKQK